MIKLSPATVGRDVELGTVDVTTEMVRRYAEDVGDDEVACGPCGVAPLGFALVLRGRSEPEVETNPATFSVHAGHEIERFLPILAPATYRVRSRVTDVFEKSGRSGPLTVICRRATLARPDGTPVAVIDDRQIVRWRPEPTDAPVRTPPRDGGRSLPEVSARPLEAVIEVGSLLGPSCRRAPDAGVIRRWAGVRGIEEMLFTDAGHAQRLGFQDVIVPGPMQSAFLEQMLRRVLRGWQLRRIAVTFRVSIIAGEMIRLGGVVVEEHMRPGFSSIVCDLWIENSEGERSATGTADLTRSA